MLARLHCVASTHCSLCSSGSRGIAGDHRGSWFESQSYPGDDQERLYQGGHLTENIYSVCEHAVVDVFVTVHCKFYFQKATSDKSGNFLPCYWRFWQQKQHKSPCSNSPEEEANAATSPSCFLSTVVSFTVILDYIPLTVIAEKRLIPVHVHIATES